MGNSLGRKRSAKIMKINGETIKLKTPVQAGEVVKDYPGHVLLESEAVKHFGIRAKPLELQQELRPKRLYFLVELPKFPEEKGARRIRSGINMSAKDRLESLMLARRSVSDLSLIKRTSIMLEESNGGLESDAMRVKMRLPKAEVEKLMMESKNEAEAAEKIVHLFMANNGNSASGGAPNKAIEGSVVHQEVHWKDGHGRLKEGFKGSEKHVGFLPVNEGEIQLAVAT